MRISSLNNRYSVSFQGNNEPPNDKKNMILFAGGSLLASSALAIASYNKPMVIKKATTNLTGFDKNKLIELCKFAIPENYIASVNNLKNKIFRIDLHTHSTHSDGWGKVYDILEQASVYANELFEKTGKKFTFALTDHDRVSGVQEAIQIIKNNPDKFKNINFVPGVELSFAFNSNGSVKFGELLAYFINPNSQAMHTLVDNLNANRLKMIDDLLQKLGQGFCRFDLDNYFLNKDGETFAYNLSQRLRNYAQIKNRINNMAKIWNEDSAHLYKYFMDSYVFEKGRVPKPSVTPEGFDAFLRRTNVYTETKMLDENIEKICKEFYPQIIDGHVVSNSENSFEKIIDTFRHDDNVVLSFAHPYFTAKQMTDYKKEFDILLRYANGRIQMSENYHQAYSDKIPRVEIEQINDYLLSKKLIPMGGRDNHSNIFIG